jgi:predicted metalloprotease with PDZ domain
MHVVMGARAGADGDWVVEGLAEYYSLELLRRSNTIGARRYRKSIARLAKRGAAVERLRVARSSGATTARGADVLRRLDRHLRGETRDRKSLDDVLRALVAARAPITTDGFRKTAEQATGVKLERFFREHAP